MSSELFEDVNKPVMKSYVYYKDRCFFVSTIDRRFITVHGSMRGEETMVWEVNPETYKRHDKILYHEGGVIDHLEICKQLRRKGEYAKQ